MKFPGSRLVGGLLLTFGMTRIWIAVLVLWPLVVHADSDPCGDAHFMHAADPALTRQRCARNDTVFEPRDPRATPPRREDAVMSILSYGSDSAGVARARGELGGELARWKTAASQVALPMPDHIFVVLDPGELGPERRATLLAERTAAIQAHAITSDDCVLAYHYRSRDPRAPFVLAHQLFHCIVLKVWEDAHLAADDASWWAEGSAEFFAGIVHPELGTAEDAATFRANEGASLLARGADAVVFFDWYCTRPGRLKGLIDTVNDKSGTALMVDLVELIGGNTWLDFEEAYYDHTIRTPAGTPVYQDTPLPQIQAVSGSTTKTFHASPFVIRGAVLQFAPDHAYELAGGDDTDFHWKWSETKAGGWSDPPHTVHTCKEKKTYRLVLAAKDREVSKTLRITARDEREADCPCVVGQWTQTAASLARVAGRLQARGIRGASCAIDGGGTTIAFTPDHSGGETYNAMHTTCTGPTISSEGTTNGTRGFTWTETGASQLTFSSAGGNATSHIVVHVRGHSSETDAPLTGQGTGAVTYRCTRTDLHLDFGTEAFDYTRAP